VLHGIESKWNKRLLNDSTKTRKKTAILFLIAQSSLAAVMPAFISAPATASTTKGVQRVVI
jgi:hypothetical protein